MYGARLEARDPDQHKTSHHEPGGESRNMETKGMTGAEAFLRVLASMGVERIFASPGSEWAPVWEFLAKPYDSPRDIPQYLSTRHEEIAVGMASGYAKATGKLPAVLLHTTVA